MKMELSGSAMLNIRVPLSKRDLRIHRPGRGSSNRLSRSSSSGSRLTPSPGPSGTFTKPLTGSSRSFTTSLFQVSVSEKKWKFAEGKAAIMCVVMERVMVPPTL